MIAQPLLSKLQIQLTLWAALLLAPTLAFAETVEDDPSQFSFKMQGFYILDFIAFFGILIYITRKPIAAMLDKRYNDVAKEIAAAKELRDAAQAKFDEYQARIDRLDEELARTMAEVRAGTAIEVQRILEDAESTVQKIAADEAQRLVQESKRIREELAREGAVLALEMAEALVRERMNPKTQEQLIERAIADLSALPSGAGLGGGGSN